MPPGDWALALGLTALTVATRWPHRARLLPTGDAVQFGRPVSHGRSLHVLRVRRRAVDHAGYHVVPVTSVARLR